MRKKRINTYLVMAIVMSGVASTSFGVSALAETTDQANTEVTITLIRKLIPSELPGNSGKPNSGTSTTPKIPPQAKASTGSLPKTGAVQSYWLGIIGSLLVGIALTVKSFERKRRKED